MDSVTLKDKLFTPFIGEEKIQASIGEIAEKINKDYRGKSPFFIGVLNGSFMFLGDLLKSIKLECKVSFIKVASYEGTTSTGNVNELIGLVEDVEGEDIILVEDIVDTGNTLEKLHELLLNKKIKSIKVATLLYKSEVYSKKFPIDYIGIEIPNKFVVGYGLDYDGVGRNLNSIYVINNN
ncbi:MAG: hypoxanthine phosphoribosyltransferase [Vicingus serpentipes]|nr:hypoxanthine phosphoribosyltransferase [Vicingus serpentipes]